MPPGHLSVENNRNETARHIVYAIYKSKLDAIELVIHFNGIHRLNSRFFMYFSETFDIFFCEKVHLLNKSFNF